MDITASIAWTTREETPDVLLGKDEKKPSPMTPALELFKGKTGKRFWETGKSANELPRVRGYDFELRWTESYQPNRKLLPMPIIRCWWLLSFLTWILGRMFDYPFHACTPSCLFVCLFVCFVLKWRLACAHQFRSLCQDQSTVAEWAEMTVAKSSLT